MVKGGAEWPVGSQPALAGDDGGPYKSCTVEKESSDFPEIHLNNRKGSLRRAGVKDEGH